jgi:hypothetical protein
LRPSDVKTRIFDLISEKRERETELDAIPADPGKAEACLGFG